MSFNIKSDRYFTAEIANIAPITPGGEPQSMEAHFKVLGYKEAENIAFDSVEKLQAFLRNVVIGISGLVDEKGKDVAFSSDVLEILLDQPDIVRPMIDAYQKGLAKAALGN